jgi:RimJ/RimL family protein N-acetyltransferase
MRIETARLVLRPLTPEDEAALATVLSDAETMRWYPRPFAARVVIDYAFENLGVERVVSMIRPENLASRRVAEKNGLTLERMVYWRNYETCIYQRTRSSGR